MKKRRVGVTCDEPRDDDGAGFCDYSLELNRNVLAAADFVAWSVARLEGLVDAWQVGVAAQRLAGRPRRWTYSIVRSVRRFAVGHVLGAVGSRVRGVEAATATLCE